MSCYNTSLPAGMLCRVITPPIRHLVRYSSDRVKMVEAKLFGSTKIDPNLIPEQETVGTALSTAAESVSNTNLALVSLPADTFTGLAGIALILGTRN